MRIESDRYDSSRRESAYASSLAATGLWTLSRRVFAVAESVPDGLPSIECCVSTRRFAAFRGAAMLAAQIIVATIAEKVRYLTVPCFKNQKKTISLPTSRQNAKNPIVCRFGRDFIPTKITIFREILILITCKVYAL